MKYLLYNPKSNNGKYDKLLTKIKGKDSVSPVSVFDEDAYKNILANQTKDDDIFIIGGDGTLNHFINNCEGIELKAMAYYVPNGTGNDFITDVDKKNNMIILLITFIISLLSEYIKSKY